MENRHAFRAVVIAVAIVGGLTAAGLFGYSLGVARGLAESPATVVAPAAAAAPGAAVPILVYPRPWGFGFGFFPFFPLLFLLFWLFVARAFFWRARWGHGWGRGYGYYGGVPPAFDEWHRRAHAQDRPDAPPPAPRTV